MRHTMFNYGDVISTTVILLIFFAIFFVMIHKIKKMKSTVPLPPEASLQQKVDDLTTRVTKLEHQMGNLSKRR